ISSSSQVSSNGSVDYAIYNPPMQFLFGSAVYHKGAWVLHMLRNELGKDVFKTIIRNYYNNFIYKNVSTNDFIDICENVSGRSLHKYFDQWVFSPGIPNLFASWTQKNNNAIIRIDQMQNETIYELNLDLKLIGLTRDTTFSITIFSQNEEYVIPFSDQISQLILDPENKVLNINNGPVYLIPNRTELIQLFPNPFNSELNIFYRVKKLQNIRIELWDILGKKIKTLQNGKKQIGTHKLTWKAENLASGTYICVLKSESNIDKRKVVLIK
ncbi:MAG: T9SS type A sorting domain-containing protein, partial [Calditrichia bacterium]|nr:T9SS type A sorting domain-containing protein [Calditrichia bacterium]